MRGGLIEKTMEQTRNAERTKAEKGSKMIRRVLLDPRRGSRITHCADENPGVPLCRRKSRSTHCACRDPGLPPRESRVVSTFHQHTYPQWRIDTTSCRADCLRRGRCSLTTGKPTLRPSPAAGVPCRFQLQKDLFFCLLGKIGSRTFRSSLSSELCRSSTSLGGLFGIVDTGGPDPNL